MIAPCSPSPSLYVLPEESHDQNMGKFCMTLGIKASVCSYLPHRRILRCGRLESWRFNTLLSLKFSDLMVTSQCCWISNCFPLSRRILCLVLSRLHKLGPISIPVQSWWALRNQPSSISCGTDSSIGCFCHLDRHRCLLQVIDLKPHYSVNIDFTLKLKLFSISSYTSS